MTHERIAIISHGHPDFSYGGAEIASYNLFEGYRANPAIEQVFYLAGVRRPRFPSGIISPRRRNEFLWDQSMYDWHMFRGANRTDAPRRFAEWLNAMQPTIIHAHHFAHMGLEMFRVIRKSLPHARVFLTLHEFLAICKNNGQMVKLDGRLCTRESPEDCHLCYPEISSEDFWLRKNFIQRYFEMIDGFIAPSEFLRQRYIRWGIAPERITVIENGQLPVEPVAHRPCGPDEPRNRFAFFGQINPFKGVDVLLEAYNLVRKREEVPIELEIHGANLEHQPAEFQSKIADLRREASPSLQWMGPYEPSALPARLANVDWVIVPSSWWENSPMVIQEAYLHRRPVVCSNLGGMAEKTSRQTRETRFEPRNPRALADTLIRLARDPQIWQANVARIQTPISAEKSAEMHLAWFAEVAARKKRYSHDDNRRRAVS